MTMSRNQTNLTNRKSIILYIIDIGTPKYFGHLLINHPSEYYGTLHFTICLILMFLLSFDFRDSSEGGKGKIGRGLSKIKRDVLGKSMEGIIDTNITEPAFDLVDICVSTSFLLQFLGRY